ncbi:Mu transposase C-terminal domain-containing protein [Chitinimonas sp.]|uniref:Mu transposase C-terminal domain-containing protein n=1 Tax=Chitinimonas sp. TaxID=1934313 RepID=UPI0035B183E0
MFEQSTQIASLPAESSKAAGNLALKSHYSAAELASLKLTGVPESVSGIFRASKRDAWAFQRRAGRGGGVEYAFTSLPASAQAEIKARIATSLVRQAKAAAPAAPMLGEVAVKSGVVGIQQNLPGLTDKDRLIADARKGVLLALQRLMAGSGCSQEAALITLLTHAAAGDVAPQLLGMLKLAKTARGRKGTNDLPSVRTLKRWLAADKCNDLAPRKVQKDMRVPAWAPAFLSHYQLPQKPTVDAAYREFITAPHGETTPSIHQVRRFLAKLGNVSREVGRMGGREIKNIKPFVRRDFSELLPGDIYSADGHCFDAEVRHPLTGKPFRPEITCVIDIATRKIVGFSVDLAESGLAVVDALRHAITSWGVPAMFYVDNGSGYVNAMMRDEATGMMARLGIEMKHSLAYNSQARGVIERSHQMWTAAAKKLPTYIGASMDREAKLASFKLNRKAIKQGGPTNLMGFADFLAFCHQQADAYNAKPHRSLGGKSPNQRWAELVAQQAPTMLAPAEAEHLFKPQVSRKVLRGELQLFNNRYFSADLEEFHGEPMRIAYDIHDAKWVWVYDRAGRFVCKAEWNGNQRAYYAKPVVEMARETRENARIKRLEGHIADVQEALQAPLTGEITYQPAASLSQQITRSRLAKEADSARVIDAELLDMPQASAQVLPMADMPRPLFARTADKYRWLMAHRGAWTNADQAWLADYVGSDEYADRVDVYEFEGIAWQGDTLMEATG